MALRPADAPAACSVSPAPRPPFRCPATTGILQSALGNLPELLILIFALRSGLIAVVQATIVGSILANVALVLGIAFIAGGLRNGVQRFSGAGARDLGLSLLLGVAAL